MISGRRLELVFVIPQAQRDRAAVVLPYLWIVTITRSSGSFMRSAVASMMRLLAWCGTSQSTVGGQLVALHQLGGDFGHARHGEFVDRGAFLMDVVQPLGDRFGGRRHAAAAGFLMQECFMPAPSERIIVSIMPYLRRTARQHRAGAVAEQHAGRAVGIVDDRRHLVGADHDDLAR
jgi:hypothetical protein